MTVCVTYHMGPVKQVSLEVLWCSSHPQEWPSPDSSPPSTLTPMHKHRPHFTIDHHDVRLSVKDYLGEGHRSLPCEYLRTPTWVPPGFLAITFG